MLVVVVDAVVVVDVDVVAGTGAKTWLHISCMAKVGTGALNVIGLAARPASTTLNMLVWAWNQTVASKVFSRVNACRGSMALNSWGTLRFSFTESTSTLPFATSALDGSEVAM